MLVRQNMFIQSLSEGARRVPTGNKAGEHANHQNQQARQAKPTADGLFFGHFFGVSIDFHEIELLPVVENGVFNFIKNILFDPLFGHANGVAHGVGIAASMRYNDQPA